MSPKKTNPNKPNFKPDGRQPRTSRPYDFGAGEGEGEGEAVQGFRLK
jgi:hypothetical protein